VQADQLDHDLHLRLRLAQVQRGALDPQAARERREVEHQRRVSEGKLAHVDDHVPLSLDRASKGAASVPLGRLVLVASTAQNRGGLIKFNDPGNLHARADGRKGECKENQPSGLD
jgi:hypothetical protein